MLCAKNNQDNHTQLDLRTSQHKNVFVQGSLIHGAVGRALLTGGAALHPDERAAEPHRGQNVFAASRPSTATTSHAPTGRDQATLCDEVGQEATHNLSFTSLNLLVHVLYIVIHSNSSSNFKLIQCMKSW